MSQPPSESPASDPLPSARALLGQRSYLLFWGSRWASSIGVQVQSVALGWQIYELARRTMDVAEAAFVVGMVGLVTFIPVFLLTLPAGEAVDRYDRRKILLACYAVEMTSAGILAVATWRDFASVPLLLCVAAIFGAGRAFMSPAGTALGPMMVPRSLLPRAIAWNSLAWQTAAIVGPAIGGLLLARSTALAYETAFCLYVAGATLTFFINGRTKPDLQPGSRLALIKEGLVYVWRQKIVFGAISLDLFAVLLGGATALLPVFARDILHVGEEGFGLLRAAPAAGATVIALILAARPIRSNAGVTMFAGVAVFGLATIVFGISRSLWLSVAALAILGGADMLSVYVRQTLIQLVIPDNMRGRVAAVSTLFIGASNELGEFRAGVFARFMGVVAAAVVGGVGTLIVTGLWAKLFPDLRKADRLE